MHRREDKVGVAQEGGVAWKGVTCVCMRFYSTTTSGQNPTRSTDEQFSSSSSSSSASQTKR